MSFNMGMIQNGKDRIGHWHYATHGTLAYYHVDKPLDFLLINIKAGNGCIGEVIDIVSKFL